VEGLYHLFRSRNVQAVPFRGSTTFRPANQLPEVIAFDELHERARSIVDWMLAQEGADKWRDGLIMSDSADLPCKDDSSGRAQTVHGPRPDRPSSRGTVRRQERGNGSSALTFGDGLSSPCGGTLYDEERYNHLSPQQEARQRQRAVKVLEALGYRVTCELAG
jgi:hypothetical protein